MNLNHRELKEKMNLVIEGVAHDLVKEMRIQCPKDTGFLMRNIKYSITDKGIEFSFPYYTVFLEYGTGIFGPKKEMITPKTKKALAWGKDLGGGKKEFVRKSVKGITPRPFIRPVFHQKFNKILIENLNRHMSKIKIRF